MDKQTEQGNLCVGGDIVLEAEFLGFEKETVARRAATLMEKGTRIPCVRKGIMLDHVKVPINGSLSCKLSVATLRKRIIAEVSERLKWKRWWHYPLGVYNYGQAALGQIPVVGKALERIAPDAWATYSLVYDLSVSDAGLLYRIAVVEKDDVDEEHLDGAELEPYIIVKGTFLL